MQCPAPRKIIIDPTHMTVIDNVDKAKFVTALAPVNAQFEKEFGKANLDKIRDYK